MIGVTDSVKTLHQQRKFLRKCIRAAIVWGNIAREIFQNGTVR